MKRIGAFCILPVVGTVMTWMAGPTASLAAEEARGLYGIHDHDPAPTEYLNHLSPVLGGGWLTATVAVGHNPQDTGGVDFTPFAEAGHTVICRINHGYYPDGTIPLPVYYDDFAQRCARFVAGSPGCNLWVIGNEVNLSGEWPFDGSRFAYVSPQQYAVCFRKVYAAIQSVRPEARVVPAALAPWAGPFGAGSLGGFPRDPNPLSWVEYLNEMLTAIAASGPLDGIALHINSRGYAYRDIHSPERRTVNGLSLSWSFAVYRDWVDYGIPAQLYHLPLYATECNGYYFWKGGHAEDPAAHYEPGWIQEIYAEINRYNQYAAGAGRPVFHCVNLYRWCAACDGWNIDGATNPYKNQMLSDLDAAVAQHYHWPQPSQARTNFVVPGAIWRYLDDGSNPGTAWRTPEFHDTAWAAGPAELGYGDGDEATVIRRDRTDGSRILTSYFRRDFLVPEPHRVTNLTVHLLCDDGGIVYLNGTEVFRHNMPAGPVGFLTTALEAVSGDAEQTYYAGTVSPALLTAGTNVIAVEIHQANATSSDVSFNLELAALTRARPRVALLSPSATPALARPAHLMLEAEAEDEDGQILRVEFRANDVRLGQATAAPWRLDWPTPPTGTFDLTAVAWDNDGWITVSAPVRITLCDGLIQAGSTWRYLDTGANAGTAWRQPDFNDASWPIGAAQLGYGDGDETTVVSYGPDPDQKHLTTYFRHAFVAEAPGSYQALLLRLLCDDGAAVYLNGMEAYRRNLPGGTLTYLTPASSAVGGGDEDRFAETNLTPLLVRAGTNLVAVEVHQANATSSDLSFDLELVALPKPPSPSLTIMLQGNSVVLRWPWALPEASLETSPTVGPDAAWAPLNTPSQTFQSWREVTVPRTGPHRFFRLR